MSRFLPGSINRLFTNMKRRRKIQFVLLIVLMLINALAEFASFGLFFLLIRLLSTDLGDQAAVGAPGGPVGEFLMALSPLILGVIFIAVLAVASGIRLLTYWSSSQFAFRLTYDFGTEAYHRYLHQPLLWHKQRNSSEVIAVVTKAQVLSNAVILPILQALTGTIVAAGAIAFLLTISFLPTLMIAIVYVGSYLIIARLVRPILREKSKQVKEAHAARIKSGQEAIGAVRDVILGGLQKHFEDRYKVFDRAYRDGQATSLVLTGMPRFILEGIGVASLIGLALYYYQRDATLGAVLPTLAALGLGAQRLLPLAQQIYAGWATVSANRDIAREVMEAAARPIGLSTERNPAPITFMHEIRLDRTSFRYSADLPAVLDNINLTVGKGKTIGFVGRTGGGKSTMIDIIMGLLTPTSGNILIDGYPLKDSRDIRRWQANIAHVPQEIVLIDASITENVAFGSHADAIDMKRVEECLSQAEILQFVKNLPNGLDTRVGERGTQLSGGQRQRIGLARALYSKANVMVLDEATSALDGETEMRVMERIANLSSEMTILIVAHRLSTLAACDEIYEVKQGHIRSHDPATWLSQVSPEKA